MAPFSMKWMTRGEYIYEGRTFNCRNASLEKEKSLNIQIFIFYIKHRLQKDQDQDQASEDPMQNLGLETRTSKHDIAVTDALDQMRMRNGTQARRFLQASGDDVTTAERAE
ncbi:Fc.00g028290.m01.CDS01 [Cosmosporella sp. VM-42]